MRRIQTDILLGRRPGRTGGRETHRRRAWRGPPPPSRPCIVFHRWFHGWSQTRNIAGKHRATGMSRMSPGRNARYGRFKTRSGTGHGKRHPIAGCNGRFGTGTLRWRERIVILTSLTLALTVAVLGMRWRMERATIIIIVVVIAVESHCATMKTTKRSTSTSQHQGCRNGRRRRLGIDSDHSSRYHGSRRCSHQDKDACLEESHDNELF